MHTSFGMLLGKYDFGQMRQSSELLAPFFFSLFCIIMAILLINLCISILSDTFSRVYCRILFQ